MNKKILVNSFIILGAMSISLASMAGSPSITFTLDGKKVTSVPVDKLHKVKVSVATGGSTFQKVFSAQWGKLNHALLLTGKNFKKTGQAPDIENSHKWSSSVVAETYYDNTWQGKTSLNADMSKVAKNMSMHNYSTEDKVVFTSRYQRLEDTGKVIWKNNGWINEQLWFTVGPTLGQATLSLEAPTFASSLDWKPLSEETVNKMNSSSESDSYMNNTRGISRTILYPSSYGGETVDFSGSKIKSLTKSGDIKYYWNYDDDGVNYYVYAKIPVNVDIHAARSVTTNGFPIPSKTEADLKCTSANLSVKRNLASNSWSDPELEIGSDFRSSCKTAEGKSADDLIKSAAGVLDGIGDIKNDPNKTNEEKAQDILKKLGF
jgi:hypothetical protein